MLDLSIIVTGHREGYLLPITLSNIADSVALCTTAGLQVEVICSLDHSDKATEEAVANWQKLNSLPLKTILVDVEDLGLNRNGAVQAAQGKYICFIDGDDLTLNSWPLAAYTYAEKLPAAQRTILQPQYVVVFGNETTEVREQFPSSKPEFHLNALFLRNYWIALCFGKRELFLNQPYTDIAGGYSYEDWHFYQDHLSSGGDVAIVPDTGIFIRRKLAGSLLQKASLQRRTVKPSNLLTVAAQQQLLAGTELAPATQPASPSLRTQLLSNRMVRAVARGLKTTVNELRSQPKLANGAQKLWSGALLPLRMQLNQLEPLLASAADLRGLPAQEIPLEQPSLYGKLADAIVRYAHSEHVYICDQYDEQAQADVSKLSQAQVVDVLVIANQGPESLPAAKVIVLAELAALSDETTATVLFQLVQALGANQIYLGNSTSGRQLFAFYSQQLSTLCRLHIIVDLAEQKSLELLPYITNQLSQVWSRTEQTQQYLQGVLALPGSLLAEPGLYNY